jgi:hypothetical protein
MGAHNRTDVAANHHYMPPLGNPALLSSHSHTHGRVSRYLRNVRLDPRPADILGDIPPIKQNIALTPISFAGGQYINRYGIGKS